MLQQRTSYKGADISTSSFYTLIVEIFVFILTNVRKKIIKNRSQEALELLNILQ